MKQYLFIFSITLLSLLSLQCLTPTEVPSSNAHSVKVRVQNSSEIVLNSVPVALYAGNSLKSGDIPLDVQYTNKLGEALFVVNIPVAGAAYTLFIGNDNTGKLRFPVKLSSRDTTIIVVLDFKELPCNDIRNDTIRLTDICARFPNGQTFSDSGQISFNSGCTGALTISFTPLHDPFRLDMIVLDGSGQVVQGSNFTLPPKGSFTVRAVASPLQEGFISKIFSLNGIGSGGSQLKLNLTVLVNSISCSDQNCRDTTLTMTFNTIAVDTSTGNAVNKIEFSKNRSSADRIDRIVVRPNRTDVFTLLDSLQSVVKPNSSQSLRIQFTPKTEQTYLDTMVIESALSGSTTKCYTIIQLKGEGCGPKCEVLFWGSYRQGKTPDDFIVDSKVIQNESNDHGFIYFANTGKCGNLLLNVDTTNFSINNGFTWTSPIIRSIVSGGNNYFQTYFYAYDNVIWPNGHGYPAKAFHQYTMKINGCGNEKRLEINVTVDTLPANYIRCIYQWSDNGNYGYNFRPLETKGSDFADPAPSANQVSDIVINSIVPGTSADVYIKSGWKLIKENITDADFEFNTVHSWKEYREIGNDTFNTTNPATFLFRSVYSLRIDREGKIGYALIRLRDISVDSDNKHKVCLDVMYPMIRNGQ